MRASSSWGSPDAGVFAPALLSGGTEGFYSKRFRDPALGIGK